MNERVTITEFWTKTAGWRRIEGGKWEPIDLVPYGGRVPMVFVVPQRDSMPEWKERFQ